ncbi:MAG TPA: pseudouridine synthase [Candidatus Paceibacterota bacterium]
MRINVFLAQQLGISRREADRLITGQAVIVQGKVAELGQQIDLDKDRVSVRGKPLRAQQHDVITIALYKPKGYVTTRLDPQKRKTVMSLLPKALKNLRPVGRLDYESEGLLLLSNDGNFIYKLTHPKYEKQKEYRLVFQKPVTKKLIERFGKGIRLEEGVAKADSVKQIEKNEIEVVIHQGWNRQLRRMAETCHYEVVKLIRTRVGNVQLDDLKPGDWRYIKGG